MCETVIYLTRHGQTEWNLQGRLQGHLNSPLTRLGEQQALWLRDRLAGERLDAIYSSTSQRAIHTAHILRGQRTNPLHLSEALMEINMGLWEGMSIEQIKLDYPVAYDRFFNQPALYTPVASSVGADSASNSSAGDGGLGETYLQLQDRVISVIKRILAAHSGGRVLIVTHRITLKVIMAYFLGYSLSEIGEMPDILSTALCKVTIHDGVPHVELLGDTSHYQEQD